MIKRKNPSSHDHAQQNARVSGYRSPGVGELWDSLPTTGSRKGARLITLAQLEAAATGPVGPHKDVTRFLMDPGTRLRHPSLEFDLSALSVTLDDGENHWVKCTSDSGGTWHFPLADLVPAGPLEDALRETVRVLTRAMTEDMVAQLIDAGALSKPDPDQLPAVRTEKLVDPPTEETTHSTSRDLPLDGQ